MYIRLNLGAISSRHQTMYELIECDELNDHNSFCSYLIMCDVDCTSIHPCSFNWTKIKYIVYI